MLLFCLSFYCISVFCCIFVFVVEHFVSFFFFKQKTAYEMRISDWSSDVCSSDLTATLYFDSCRVPVANRIGPENQGFMAIMLNFNQERLMLAAQACAFANVCYEESLDYARERETFGRPLIRNQVIRHKLVDMRTLIDAVKDRKSTRLNSSH